jgi:hypothetical protein
LKTAFPTPARSARGFAEKLFWSVLGHLQHSSPDFAAGHMGEGLLWRFKVRLRAVDFLFSSEAKHRAGISMFPPRQK